MAPLTSLTLLATLLGASSAHYTLSKDFSYKNFFENFDFFSDPDPTNGFVQYQNETSAIANNYAGYLNDTQSVFLGVDHTSKDPNGRASVRLESKFSFNHGLLIADITHMPDNVCGSWPAFWLLGAQEWPAGGEIDILEGVNDDAVNSMTIHTTDGCRVDNSTGGLDNCNINAPDEERNIDGGCSIKARAVPTMETYGIPFNIVGGGVYALEWTDSFIQVWFFPRNSPSFPSRQQLEERPEPSTWGAPLARFQGEGCDFSERFKDLRIIFNTAFCGDWAGQPGVWDYSCKQKTGVETCAEYVRDNPEAFEYSYWEIKGLRLFEEDGSDELSVEKRHGGHGSVHRQGRRFDS